MQAEQSFLWTPFVSNRIAPKERYFPAKGETWQAKLPSEFNINTQKIEAAVNFALANEYTGGKNLREALVRRFRREPFHQIAGPVRERGNPCGIILKNGYIIAQWGNTQRVDMTFSVTKSYLSTVAGLALHHGLIDSLDDPVGQYIHDDLFADTHNAKVTWAHFLTQSSEWSGELWGGYDWAESPPRTGTIEDWKNRKPNEPGTCFKYSNMRANVLAYALTQLWRKPLPQIIKEKVMDKIGASNTWSWHGYAQSKVNIDGEIIESVSSGGHWGGGLFISTEDHARYGLLFLNNGHWNDKQVLPPDWVHKATQPSFANQNYGYMWWLNRKVAYPVNGKQRHWDGVPERLFYASGLGGNLIVIDQKNDLVIVTRWFDPVKNAELMRRIMAAVQGS